MKTTVRRSPFARRVVALFLVAAAAAASSGLTIPAVAAAAAQSFTPPGGKGDYLVHVGKRAVWASSLPKRQPGTSVADLRGSTRAWTQGDRDYLVTVGKRTLRASQVHPTTPPAVSAPAAPRTTSRGRFVTIGKATFWVQDGR